MKVRELRPEQLKKTVDPSIFKFSSTADIPPLERLVGQERAVSAMEFGISIRTRGYGIYMAGPPGTGKTTYAINLITDKAASEPVPDDWCYVYNFEEPDRPVALRLPPGKGAQLRRDMQELIADLRVRIPRAFEGKEYEERRSAIIQRFQKESQKMIAELEQMAAEEQFQVVRTHAGFVAVPVKEGKTLDQEEFQSLPREERESIEERGRRVQAKLAEVMKRIHNLEKETKQKIKELEKEIAIFVAQHPIQELKEEYGQYERVVRYLDAVLKDVAENLEAFRTERAGDKQTEGVISDSPRADRLNRYRVNLLVDNSATKGAPVVVEPNPTYYNLLGKMEYEAELGVLFTDFTMIKPGALHKANGGYLILQAADLLRAPFAWEGLKRALKSGEVRIENIGEQYRVLPTSTLHPDPIPIDVKVILIGEPLLYHLLYYFDPDFRKLFKVKADFDVEMEMSQDHVMEYAAFIGSVCRREGLRHFDPTGVAQVIEYGSRLVGDQAKLSTRFNEIVEVIYEANEWARREGADLVGAEHVRRAIEEKQYRSNMIEQKIHEQIRRGKILVDTQGAVVGQVNGISLIHLGDYLFGKPSRITATVHVGDAGIVDIERETKLAGRIHNKGVLILGGYLGRRFGRNTPLSLSASICFEQLYEEVEGDSASSAELYALLSALAEVPIKQSLAVTGSVNQKGEIQPVGGVTWKVEGFYEVCKLKGLTGDQGVIIPQANVDNLVLKDEVIEAVAAGKFHIYPVTHVDEAMEILTGIPAGEEDQDGNFPPDTINGRVQARLRSMAERLAEHRRHGGRQEG